MSTGIEELSHEGIQREALAANWSASRPARSNGGVSWSFVQVRTRLAQRSGRSAQAAALLVPHLGEDLKEFELGVQ